ncbi:MAG: aminopeptidase P family protein, partial [Acidisphaera sp.]|nr:aminopeptidase P family protein [Acidisphaera sp.]
DEPPAAWLAEAAPGGRIGYDPLLHGEEALRRFIEAGIALVPLDDNPLDAVWRDRPPPPAAPIVPHPLDRAGLASAEKRAAVAEDLRRAGQDAAVLCDPASIAWLLNIRGGDVPFTPFPLSFALQHADGSCDLFVAPAKLTDETRAWLGNAVAVAAPGFAAGDPLPSRLASLRGKTVRVDPDRSPAWFAQRLREAGAVVASGMDPCVLPKARKNATEQAGARAAHARDAVAVIRFLHWLNDAAGTQTEMSAAARLLAWRAEAAEFRGESFPAISGAGPNGAVIHYRVTEESDRPIGARELYLVDSGAQYVDGTTDVTRTVWTGADAPPAPIRDRFTRVLKGHIAVATLVFPVGVAGPHLDAFARAALWQVGLDFDHGTGHGVGSYLSVHEGPVTLSRTARPVPLASGMILSDEPGFYAPGEYGIRLENLLLVQDAELEGAAKPFLRFETLTWAPFDRRCIDVALLTRAERMWLDAYHAEVLSRVGPALPEDARSWLESACAPL